MLLHDNLTDLILKFTDLNSSRTLFIFGFSLFSAMVIPDWIHKYPESLNTGKPERRTIYGSFNLPPPIQPVCNSGVPVLDQVITILLTTNMFVGGFLGFVLDNTIPGELTKKWCMKLSQQSL